MATVAKFRCTEITKRAGGSQYHPVTDEQIAMQQVDVVLVAAKTTDEDNVDWSRWTPAGELRMTITNPDAFRQFEVDTDYVLEIRKAQPQKARSGDVVVDPESFIGARPARPGETSGDQ